MTMLNTRVTPVVAAVALIALTAGCSGGSPSPKEAAQSAASTPNTSAAAVSSCRPFVPFSKGGRAAEGQALPAQQVAETVKLPAGVSIVTGRLSTDSDEPGMFAVTVDLCGGAITSADELRPLATQFAKAYKAVPAVGDQMFALRVAHYTNYTETDASGEVMVKDADFQLHLWNGKPSPDAELSQWEAVHG
jgi:hypothetical protein